MLWILDAAHGDPRGSVTGGLAGWESEPAFLLLPEGPTYSGNKESKPTAESCGCPVVGAQGTEGAGEGGRVTVVLCL